MYYFYKCLDCCEIWNAEDKQCECSSTNCVLVAILDSLAILKAEL